MNDDLRQRLDTIDETVVAGINLLAQLIGAVLPLLPDAARARLTTELEETCRRQDQGSGFAELALVFYDEGA